MANSTVTRAYRLSDQCGWSRRSPAAIAWMQ